MKKVGRTRAYICMAAIAAGLFLCHPAYGEVEIYDLDAQAPESTLQEDSGITEEALPPEGADSPASKEAGLNEIVEEVRIQGSREIESELPEPDTQTSGILTVDEEAGDRELPAIAGYDTERPQTFIHLFTNGVKISSSVPNGGLTSEEVNLQIVGEAPVSVYKDEETIKWENGMILQAAGNYTVITGKETFSFRISRYFTKSRWFYSPEGFQIKQVKFNNNTIMLHDRDRFLLSQDGVYEVELLSDSAVVLPCSFEKDSSQPEFIVNASKGGTAVEFQSTDIEAIQVYKDGKEIRPAYNYMFTEAGAYRILCFDHAGNLEEKEFEVSFKFNRFSILLLLLTIGITGALIGTVFVTKNKFKIR